jgi:hypothetical protein
MLQDERSGAELCGGRPIRQGRMQLLAMAARD